MFQSLALTKISIVKTNTCKTENAATRNTGQNGPLAGGLAYR